jgi:phosphotriesterase-related protein
MVREFRDGVASTGVRAGVIGEQGTYADRINAREREVFLASADAALATGLAISTHTHAGELAAEQAELLLEAGVEPHKIIIGHMDDRSPLADQMDLFRNVLDLGVYLQFDDIGFSYYSPTLDVQMPTDQERAMILADLIQEGYLGQIVLGIDVCQARHLAARGGPGFAYLVRDFTEITAALGIDDAEMKRMLVDNPARALSFEQTA